MSSLPEPKLSAENAITFFGLAYKDDAEVLAEKAIEFRLSIFDNLWICRGNLIKCAQSFKFEGYITKNNGVGRSSSDRQFFYINKRPVDMPFLARILNSGQTVATILLKNLLVSNSFAKACFRMA